MAIFEYTTRKQICFEYNQLSDHLSLHHSERYNYALHLFRDTKTLRASKTCLLLFVLFILHLKEATANVSLNFCFVYYFDISIRFRVFVRALSLKPTSNEHITLALVTCGNIVSIFFRRFLLLFPAHPIHWIRRIIIKLKKSFFSQ